MNVVSDSKLPNTTILNDKRAIADAVDRQYRYAEKLNEQKAHTVIVYLLYIIICMLIYAIYDILMRILTYKTLVNQT